MIPTGGARGVAGQPPRSVRASPAPSWPRAGGDTGSFVPGRYFSPGGLEAGVGIGAGAEMPHAEVILMIPAAILDFHR